MRKTFISQTLLIGLLTLSQFTFAAENQGFHWPKGIKAAVNLAYDDALDSQLDNAIPALDKYGLKGTFYIKLASPTVASRLSEWRAAAKNDHELANHTLFHPCSKSLPGREWVPPYYDLDKMTIAEIKDEVALASTMLHAIDGKTERTYTAPCVDTTIGGVNYIDAIKSQFVAIKSRSGAVTEDMMTVDPYYVSVAFPSDVTGQQLIDLVEQAGKKGTMVNFTFHGVGGDYLTTSNEAHETLLKYLKAHSDEYWTDTFINIMKYVKAEQAKNKNQH